MQLPPASVLCFAATKGIILIDIVLSRRSMPVSFYIVGFWASSAATTILLLLPFCFDPFQ